MTGASPHGQGQETSFAQIAADELGVDLNDVTVIHGDTGIVQYGIGTFGSRAAQSGTAVYIAIQKLKEKANKIAAHMLQSDATRLSFEGGKYSLSAAAGAAAGAVPNRLFQWVKLRRCAAGTSNRGPNESNDSGHCARCSPRQRTSARYRTGIVRNLLL